MDGLAWFPAEWTYEFFLLKGVLALVGTLLTLAHMQQEWSEAMTLGRRLRYFALLVFAVVLTGASVEQVAQDAVVELRNIGGMVSAVVLVVAVGVSIREARRR